MRYSIGLLLLHSTLAFQLLCATRTVVAFGTGLGRHGSRSLFRGPLGHHHQSSSTAPSVFLHQSASTSSSSESTSSSTSISPSLTLFSPCKINLFLRILRKRADGYHDLASLFQSIGFGDTLELSVLDNSNNGEDVPTEDVFSCNMPGVPVDQTNLVLRALELMRTKTGKQDVYFHANLIKQVPAQAGLGGGSANAATAMFGANQLMGRPASTEQLIEWSAELGSDITFFLSRGTAYCTGRGEIMTPLDPPLPSGTPVCIVKPQTIGLSTPAVFQALDYELLSAVEPEDLLEEFRTRGVRDIDNQYYINDLEPPAFQCVPELKKIKEDLMNVEGFQHVMMSGSGTSIFCIGEPVEKEAFDKEFGGREDLLVYQTEFIDRPDDTVWYERQVS